MNTNPIRAEGRESMGHHNFDAAGELAAQLAVRGLVDHLNEENLGARRYREEIEESLQRQPIDA